MSGTRVYLPSTFSRLREVVRAGGVGPPPVRGHAVTEALRAAYVDGSEEDWEYAAMSSAAQDALGLLTEDDPPRRVVIVLSDAAVVPAGGDDPSLVELQNAASARTIAAVHVDSPDAEADVAAARAAWRDAQEGDPSAAAVVERCADHDLGWYATQEIGDLLDQPGPDGMGAM
jgi:hypothetical protein